jgi:hypothetical protein
MVSEMPEFPTDDGFAFERYCGVPQEHTSSHLVLPLPALLQSSIEELVPVQHSSVCNHSFP